MTRAASLCSGIGAPETALPHWDWAWCAEIEPHPCRVLAARFPHSFNLGDLTAGDFSARAAAFGPLDVLVAGTPCQAFSVAGLRGGLSDARGNITLRALQIYEDMCDAARSAGRPAPIYWWENVPGVLTHEDNPFGCFLGAIAGSATPLVPPHGCRWSDAGLVAGPRRTVAWRILDAQYFGVPQRRPRLFVVAGAGNGFDPAEILFERQGVRRDTAPRGEEGEIVAPTIGRGSPGGRVYGLDADTVESLQVCATRDASHGRLQGCSGQDPGHGYSHLITHGLTAEGFDASEDGTGRGTPIVPLLFDPNQITSAANRSSPKPGGLCHTLPGSPVPPVITFDCKGTRPSLRHSDISETLRGDGHGSGHAAVATEYAVRRLTPTECERLQGFPDGHTDVPDGNRPAADGPRYKSLGNSMPVPVIAWIGARIERQRMGVGENG